MIRFPRDNDPVEQQLEIELAKLGMAQDIPVPKRTLAVTILRMAVAFCKETGDPRAWRYPVKQRLQERTYTQQEE